MYAGIYVKNVSKTADIFKKALGAKAKKLQPNMIELTVGKGRLLLNEKEMNSVDSTDNSSSSYISSHCKELELGIWVNNIDLVHNKILSLTNDPDTSNIRYVSDIEKLKSGIKDFRFKLTDGYYVRVSSSSN